MTDKIFDTNQVSVAGEVMNNFLFSHEVFGEGFYLIDVYVPRLSKTYDVIPLWFQKELLTWRPSR